MSAGEWTIEVLQLCIALAALILGILALRTGTQAANIANQTAGEVRDIEKARLNAEEASRTVEAYWANARRGEDDWVWGVAIENLHDRSVRDVEVDVVSKGRKGQHDLRRTGKSNLVPPGRHFLPDVTGPMTPEPEGLQPLSHAKHYRVLEIRYTDPDGKRRVIVPGA